MKTLFALVMALVGTAFVLLGGAGFLGEMNDCLTGLRCGSAMQLSNAHESMILGVLCWILAIKVVE